MASDRIQYFQPRVMRHHKPTGDEEYAVHEVYFDEAGGVVTYSQDALSPREASVEELRATLIQLVEAGDAEIVTGDLNYTYSREYLEEWLANIQHAPLEFE